MPEYPSQTSWRTAKVVAPPAFRKRLRIGKNYANGLSIAYAMTEALSLPKGEPSPGAGWLLYRIYEQLVEAHSREWEPTRDRARVLIDNAFWNIATEDLDRIASDFGWDDLPVEEEQTEHGYDEFTGDHWWDTVWVVDRAATIDRMSRRLTGRVFNLHRQLAAPRTQAGRPTAPPQIAPAPASRRRRRPARKPNAA